MDRRLSGEPRRAAPPDCWRYGDTYYDLLLAIQQDRDFEEYVVTFLKRTYLRNVDALSRRRPSAAEAEIWFGQNHAEYGLLVTPRYVHGTWENDGSEIRHFPEDYWTIGHVLQTGLVVPDDPDRIEFANTNAYLTFFKNTLVRASGSKHEKAVARRYVNFVRAQPDPTRVPLLIPELRYEGRATAHTYRLDFTVIDPYTMEKVGFELSPWSSHGKLTGKGKTLKQLNAEARSNFEKEMRKHKDYYREHGIFALIYTDTDLEDPDALFLDFEKYLRPRRAVVQLEFEARAALHRFE